MNYYMTQQLADMEADSIDKSLKRLEKRIDNRRKKLDADDIKAQIAKLKRAATA